MPTRWPEMIRSAVSEETALTVAIVALVVGLLFAYLAWRGTHRFLRQIGVTDTVEGTSFERTAQRFGTSTAGILALLVALFVYAVVALFALNLIQVFEADLFWSRVTNFLPRLFVALLALIAGLLVGEKAQLLFQERLQSIKLPEISIVPLLVKYSIYYIAVLIALAQLGVATDALLILLAAYAFGLIFLAGLAFRDLLTTAAAGIYILLNEPYSIGDEVRINDTRGIVQEVDMFVTYVETNGEEYIIPNREVLRSGVVRIRNQ